VIDRCKNCIYPVNHPLGLLINSEGICSGCLLHTEKNSIDWEYRFDKLRELVNQYKSKKGNYDCIVPVSGGQDSFYIVHTIVNRLGLNPILVNFNRNFNSKVGLANLARLKTSFDVDFRQQTINPLLARKIVRTTAINIGSVNWLWIAGQTSFPLRVAESLKIPLIIWGAHQGMEQVGMFSHFDEVEMSRRYRLEHDLMGVDEEGITAFDTDFSKLDLSMIQYPSDHTIFEHGIRGIYLGNFVRWDPVKQHSFVRKSYGYLGAVQPRSYYAFDNPDCDVYNNYQDLLKVARVGFGKVTDQLVREIRHGRISRSKALRLEKRYLRKSCIGLEDFAQWLGTTVDFLKIVLHKHDKNLFSLMLTKNFKSYGINFSKQIEDKHDSSYQNFGKGS
jgi:N-acetyl sugar amidotransferase